MRGLSGAALLLLVTMGASAQELTLTEDGTLLQLGEYNCTLPDGATPGGPSFIAVSDTEYTDMDGGNAGSISIASGSIAFTSGVLDGLTGSAITPERAFTLSDGAICSGW